MSTAKEYTYSYEDGDLDDIIYVKVPVDALKDIADALRLVSSKEQKESLTCECEDGTHLIFNQNDDGIYEISVEHMPDAILEILGNVRYLDVADTVSEFDFSAHSLSLDGISDDAAVIITDHVESILTDTIPSLTFGEHTLDVGDYVSSIAVDGTEVYVDTDADTGSGDDTDTGSGDDDDTDANANVASIAQIYYSISDGAILVTMMAYDADGNEIADAEYTCEDADEIDGNIIMFDDPENEYTEHEVTAGSASTTIATIGTSVLDYSSGVVTGYIEEHEAYIIANEVDGVETTAIGEGAFSGCTGLTSITIPDSVTTIDSNAFSGCTSLTIYYQGNEDQWNDIDIGASAVDDVVEIIFTEE